MNKLKASLDSKSRRHAKSRSCRSRADFERQLCPTTATLVIVPLALVEHWYEQIVQHLNLSYFVDHGEDIRGLVYLDGLGDIADIQPPISRLELRADSIVDSIEKVSNYLLVVTTLERCAKEGKYFRAAEADYNWSDASASGVSALLQLRWLRLVVDEGHELTLHRPSTQADSSERSDSSLYYATQFITLIAGERRWIMSGTPTVGATAEHGLQKLFVHLSFLRHPDYGLARGGSGEALWRKHIVEPCVKQDPKAWQILSDLLRSIMVRHLKDDLVRFRPIHSDVILEPLREQRDEATGQAALLADDRAKAKYVADTMMTAKAAWIAARRKSLDFASQSVPSLGSKPIRRPKAIVFSQFNNDLQGVGHFLYAMLGDQNVCEHFGRYKSSELSRFRHSKRKFRTCSMCGHENGITAEKYCEKVLFMVEYVDFANPWADHNGIDAPVPNPEPGGHGTQGPGGHYVGRCLCSPIGCVSPCSGFPNPFYYTAAPATFVNPNLALVAAEHIRGWIPGVEIHVGQTVHVLAQEPHSEATPLLWKGGRMGGTAVVRQWRRCGGTKEAHKSWHGSQILCRTPWQVVDEDAMILLLAKDGSTGLDLSFATHIFLLERIGDPALRNQIISRAYRVGATGPVEVQLLQVVADKD